MTWHADDPQGNEADKVKYDVVQFLRGAVLDLGCGPKKVFPHALGVDNCVDTALFGIAIQPDVQVPDCTDLSDAVNDASVDAIFSSHLLEHIEDTQAALTDWWRCLKVGGYLVLYLPHKDLYPNVGTPGANPDHKHDFVPEDILACMATITGGAFDVRVNEVRSQAFEYSFLLVIEKLSGEGLGPHWATRPKPAKTACISRFGGFGDMLQMANLLPELKRQGYHVTINTTPQGQSIIQHDPHVDDWLIVDPDQVPNHELPEFWAALGRRFTKFIQLSESIEGTLLAIPGRANHAWPHAVRTVELNRNYLEWTAQLAELPYLSEARFYPTDDEVGQANDLLRAQVQHRTLLKHGGPTLIGVASEPVFSIVWALAGSSMHKFMPHQDAVIARVMLEMPEAVVLFTGDQACQLLERGWESEARVVGLSGKQGIRDTLALAQLADCVVGPETGVLNAVAFEPDVAKVVFLSHSSHENLTKHWLNTQALAPVGQHCYPCHQLHHGSRFCDEDAATGAAMCQVRITPDRIYDAIARAYAAWQER